MPFLISLLTEITEKYKIHRMKLSQTAQRFILHWGEMGSAWGVNRSVAQIHALLFFHGEPMHAEDICETLSLARSNASNSLKELLSWKLIRSTQVLGDRRQYFETSADVWDLFRTIIKGRKEREFDPTVQMLRELTEAPEFAGESPEAQKRVNDTLKLMNSLEAWVDEMLRLNPSTMEKLLRMGAQVQKLLRGRDNAKD